MNTPPDRDDVASLKQFFTVQEIADAWETVFRSVKTRSEETITITSKSQDGRSASGIVLATRAEKKEFIRACRQALFEEDPDNYPDPGYGRSVHTDVSTRPVMM